MESSAGTSLDFDEWPGSSFSTAASNFITILTLVVTAVLFLYHPFDNLFLSLKLKRSGRPPLPPGSSGFPIIGELLQFISNPIRFACSRHAKYGPIFKTTVLGGEVVFIEPPVGNRFVFTNEEKLLETAHPTYFKRIFGETCLLSQIGAAHRLTRRHIMPYFNPHCLAQYVPRIEEHVQIHFKDFWRPSGGEDHGQDFEISLLESMRRVLFHAIADLVLGLKPHEAEKIRPLHHALARGMLTVPINIPGTPLYNTFKARAKLLEVQRKLVEARRAELREGKASPTQDLMSYLLTHPDDSGRLLPDEAIHDNLVLFVAAGHETSTSVLPLALRFLCLYPEARQRVLDEHAAIARRKAPGEGLVKEDLGEMKYTWWVVQETMRMHTPVAGGFRKVLQDTEFGGYTIPKGWKLAWTPAAHSNPKVFENPEAFDPTRFDGRRKIPPYAFVPFSGGHHSCAGIEFAKMEILVIMYNVMKDYTFTLVDPDEPLTVAPFPQQTNGTRIRVKRRLHAPLHAEK